MTSSLWKKFRSHKLGYVAFWVVVLFFLIALFAPFLASSKPLFVVYQKTPYFPLFRYLFYQGFYTKKLDVFFNLLSLTLPLAWISWKLFKNTPLLKWILSTLFCFHCLFFTYLSLYGIKDPLKKVPTSFKNQKTLSWSTELLTLSPYEKLTILLNAKIRQEFNQSLEPYQTVGESKQNFKTNTSLPTLWNRDQNLLNKSIERQKNTLKALTEKNLTHSVEYEKATSLLHYLEDKHAWTEQEKKHLSFLWMPLLRPFHWEEDAGGDATFNPHLPFWQLTRPNQKDLMAALIFGIRISLTVGLLSVGLSFIIGIFIGALSGYYGGKLDIIVCRLLEIWESMPTFFVLLLVTAIAENKSIFLVIFIIGIFGWPPFSRYIRGEFFKQRHLQYVEACHCLGFSERQIIFSHILPNAIPPVLTLLPFAIMGAITSEAGLSFLGLGEEGSCSLGVLMDEGRAAFPGQSYLLWPPALLLTILLIAIALIGDALRDVLDPRG